MILKKHFNLSSQIFELFSFYHLTKHLYIIARIIVETGRTILVDGKVTDCYNIRSKTAITRAPRKGGDARHLLRSPCTLVDSCRYTYAFWAGYRHILCKNRAEMEP